MTVSIETEVRINFERFLRFRKTLNSDVIVKQQYYSQIGEGESTRDKKKFIIMYKGFSYCGQSCILKILMILLASGTSSWSKLGSVGSEQKVVLSVYFYIHLHTCFIGLLSFPRPDKGCTAATDYFLRY